MPKYGRIWKKPKNCENKMWHIFIPCDKKTCQKNGQKNAVYLQDVSRILLSDSGKPEVQSLGPDVSESETFFYFTDVTLADKDATSIPTDNANRAIHANKAIPGNVALQVTQPRS